MTIEEKAIANLKYAIRWNDKPTQKSMEIAIASLEEWEKVRQEIEDLEKSYGFDKATKYGNKDGKQMDLSYSTMYMYEIAGLVDEIKEIIDKHIKEVESNE